LSAFRGGCVVKIEIYSKKDCHLCDEAKAKLREFAERFPIHVDEIDIEQDPVVFEKHRYEIPVVYLEGRKLFKYRIDDAKLERAIRAAMKS